MWKTAFKQFEGVWSVYIDHNHFNFFKGCFPRNLFGPILNTLPQMLFNWLSLFHEAFIETLLKSIPSKYKILIEETTLEINGVVM